MRPRSALRLALAITGVSVARVLPLAAQSAPGASWAEAGGFYHRVTHGFGDWQGAYARVVLAGRRDVWYFDVKGQEAFHDRGAYGSLANVHTLGSRVYTQIGVGGGSGRYVLPDLRVDASVSLKLGSARSVVATAGGTLVNAKNGYEDRALFGLLSWYAATGVLVEGGGRVNWSRPGQVASGRVNGALTLGRSGRTLVTLRGGAGREGYQLLGATTLRKIRSQEAGLVWRQWASRQFGLVLGGEWYHNPSYTRAGLTAGVFVAW